MNFSMRKVKVMCKANAAFMSYRTTKCNYKKPSESKYSGQPLPRVNVRNFSYDLSHMATIATKKLLNPSRNSCKVVSNKLNPMLRQIQMIMVIKKHMINM